MICPNCKREYDEFEIDCQDCMIPLEEELDENKEYVVILRTGSKPEVAVMKSILNDAEIPYGVKGEEIQDLIGVGSIGVGINFAIGPMEIIVNKEYIEEVVNLLKAMQQELPEEMVEE